MALRNLILFHNHFTKLKNIMIFQSHYTKLKSIMSKSVCNMSYNSICMSTLSSCQNSQSIINKELENLEIIKYCKTNEIPIPEHITQEQHQCLESMNFYQQLKYIHYLVVTEFKKKKNKAKKEKLKEEKKVKLEQIKNQFKHIEYGNNKNSMFAKTEKQAILNLYDHRLASAIMYNQVIIFDLSFDNTMNRRDRMSLVNHLKWCVTHNRRNRNPFNLAFTNVEYKSETIIFLQKIMPRIFEKDVPMTVSSETYLNLYPKEKLVYLTPNAEDEMTRLDPQAIYIIGGIVDRGIKHPLTFTKAQEEGIKTQRLPLDKYLHFKGYKTLNIHVVLAILLEVQETGDWKKALENVPKRLVKTTRQETELETDFLVN